MAYKRAQVIWSLWCVFAGPFRSRIALNEVPPTFARRISNLIDLGAGISKAQAAGKTGVDREYGVEEAFELGVGLDLLGVGLHQREIVNFLLRFRDELSGHCKILPETARPGAEPAFLVVRPVGLKETLRKEKIAIETGPVAFHAPLLLNGKAKLEAAILKSNASMDDRRFIVIEVSDLKTKLIAALEDAPEIKRGRR
jgi:hypothetical protein